MLPFICSDAFENDLFVGEYVEGNFVFNSLCSNKKKSLGDFKWRPEENINNSSKYIKARKEV